MKKHFLLSIVIAAIMLLTGCAGRLPLHLSLMVVPLFRNTSSVHSELQEDGSVDMGSTLISRFKPTLSSGINASLANDDNPGNAGGYFDSILYGDKDAWWQVDLGGIYTLTSIVNRNYVDGVRYYHYYVRVSLDGENWSAPIAWKYNNNPALDDGETFQVTGVARYVRVNIISHSANMSAHLTNFEVYGSPITQTVSPAVEVHDVLVEPAYANTETIDLAYQLTNATQDTLDIRYVYAIVFGLSNPYYRRFQEINADLSLAANASYSGTASLWQVDAGMAPGSYGVFIRTELDDGRTWEAYHSFFRVIDGNQLLSYSIDMQTSGGFPVYTLDGGLSAEYAVLKSAQILTQSAGPSWEPSAPGYGPRPVYATPHFLQDAIAETIDTLDDALGEDQALDTVIFAPGIQSTPQLIFTLQAPVLPLHYLVSFNSVYELKTVIEQAAEDGYDVLATLGWDGSMDPGVAWIKLLSPPDEYLAFIERHAVQNVVMAGSSGTQGGENYAQRVIYDGSPTTGHNPGDIFVINPGGGSAQDTYNLYQRIHDLGDLPLAAAENISDWEAGLLPEQTQNFASAIAPEISGDFGLFTAPSYYDIDNMGVYVTAAFYHKNAAQIAVGGQVVRGIALSPYMTSHPFAEAAKGYLPVLFFQGESSLTIVEGRILNIAQSALDEYFPNAVAANNLPVDVLTSRNFGGFANSGIASRLDEFEFSTYTLGNTSVDEVWDLSDGVNAWNEKALQELSTMKTHAQWTDWNAALDALDMDDLDDISERFANIQFSIVQPPTS